MRYAHTAAQIRSAEEAHPGLGSGALMRRAAHGLATTVIGFLDGVYGRRIVVLVGGGNNGGDALFAGAHLARRGAAVEAWLLAERAHRAGLAAFTSAGGQLREPRPLAAGAVDAVIDGVLGIGGRPGLPARVAEAVIPIDISIPFIAVDLPSGLDADTGKVTAMALKADLTVTFGSHKVAHLTDPAAAQCGVVALVDLDLDLEPAQVSSLQPADVAALLRAPRANAHKYTRGVVGVRAGSQSYPGAALLCVAGANTGLAGMVRYVGSARDHVITAHPEVVGAGTVQAWVVGPGGGDEAAGHLEAALGDDVPVVVDADALAAFAAHPVPHSAGLVLTPHAGELARMMGVERAEVEASTLEFARAAAAQFNAVVLLKGRRTVIASPDGTARINTSGNAWLATAGAGDVLAGLIGSLLASGLAPADAAAAGAWIHGAAGTLASQGGPVSAGMVAAAISRVVGEWLL